MDQQNYNPYTNNPYQQQPYGYRPKPVNRFETTAIVFAIASIITCSFFYASFIFGGLAIIFALLSRGDKIKLSTNAKLAVFLGIAGILLTIVVYVFAFYILLEEYGSLEGILRAACEMSGYDFEEVYGELFQ